MQNRIIATFRLTGPGYVPLQFFLRFWGRTTLSKRPNGPNSRKLQSTQQADSLWGRAFGDSAANYLIENYRGFVARISDLDSSSSYFSSFEGIITSCYEMFPPRDINSLGQC